MYAGAINNEAEEAYTLAVTKFQLSQKIAGDGLVGMETYAKLREAWPEFFGKNTSNAPTPPAQTMAPEIKINSWV
jgi:hypothetical protein